MGITEPGSSTNLSEIVENSKKSEAISGAIKQFTEEGKDYTPLTRVIEYLPTSKPVIIKDAIGKIFISFENDSNDKGDVTSKTSEIAKKSANEVSKVIFMGAEGAERIEKMKISLGTGFTIYTGVMNEITGITFDPDSKEECQTKGFFELIKFKAQ